MTRPGLGPEDPSGKGALTTQHTHPFSFHVLDCRSLLFRGPTWIKIVLDTPLEPNNSELREPVFKGPLSLHAVSVLQDNCHVWGLLHWWSTVLFSVGPDWLLQLCILPIKRRETPITSGASRGETHFKALNIRIISFTVFWHKLNCGMVFYIPGLTILETEKMGRHPITNTFSAK